MPIFGVTVVSVPVLSGIIIAVSVAVLLLGGYSGLDKIIKAISVVLLLTVLIAFVAVIVKGPIETSADFQAPPLLEGAGLALLIGLLGWMPAGLEASTMNSIWNVEKMRSTNYHPRLKESLFDFNLGYILTVVLALMFMTIGAFSVYGSGKILDGNSTQFTNKLLNIFTTNLGAWSYYVVAIAAFGAIYGTLIAILDAFPRCFVRGIRVLKYETIENDEEQINFLERYYKIFVLLVGTGGFLLFYLSSASMIKLLEYVTILSFLLSPIIGFINLRAIQSEAVPLTHRPSKVMLLLAYLGLAFMVAFAIYYLSTLVV